MFVNYSLNNPKRSIEFNETPRCGIGGREQIINRFCQVESRWGYSGTSDRVRFSVNRRIFVIGLGLYGSIYGRCEYQVLIQVNIIFNIRWNVTKVNLFLKIFHSETGTTCAQNNTTFTCDGSSSTFRVLFKEPVSIKNTQKG